MNTPKFLSLIGLLLCGALASCGPQLDTARVPVSKMSAGKGSSSLSGRLHGALNGYRAGIGKSALPRDPNLDRLAYEHCVFMARNRGKFSLGSANISHYGFEERVLVARRRYGMASMAENVAGGVIQGDIPAQLVTAWTSSKRHSYNLRQNWECTGIGVHVTDDGMVYATQIFATRVHSQMATLDRFRQF